MKQWFFVWRCYGNNEYYYLRHADAGTPPPEGWERITRKQAEKYRSDNRLYKYCSSVTRSDYGDTEIKPFTENELNPPNKNDADLLPFAETE
ncbi:MAG: hypothetical protein J6V11_00345 [Alphaproteobacteria bacterium]|nr:hypothetical protein [Alphaproteobacteria bacterium]